MSAYESLKAADREMAKLEAAIAAYAKRKEEDN